MSKLGTSTYKETLKNYAYGVAQDVGSKLADFIAPRVPVGVGTGMFKKFDDKNAFQIYDTSRAVGGGGRTASTSSRRTARSTARRTRSRSRSTTRSAKRPATPTRGSRRRRPAPS